jgi:hypothetical protein
MFPVREACSCTFYKAKTSHFWSMSKKAILALTGPKITDGRRCKPHNHNDAPWPFWLGLQLPVDTRMMSFQSWSVIALSPHPHVFWLFFTFMACAHKKNGKQAVA